MIDRASDRLEQADTQLTLPRYERPREEIRTDHHVDPAGCIPYAESDAIIAASALSRGSQTLARGLLRLGCTRMFGGGGAGIEYGSLLKTAVRPDLLAGHVQDAADHLQDRRVDLLIVPGMSGYPVGAMYSVVSGIPTVLLKKVKLWADASTSFPPGAFVIPSYTGDGDVVMHADEDALQDIVEAIVQPQLEAQAEAADPVLTVRVAGADDIIDKATMSLAVSECAPIVCRAAIDTFLRRNQGATGDQRPVTVRIEVVAWVTPLIKGYNGPIEYLERTIGVRPFAGVNVTSVHLSPPAIGIEGVGIVAFETR